MKNSLLTLLLLILLIATAFAQNKSLGVGTATPNTNAALHVNSETNNQGFIMPRLTTSQRNNLGSSLTPTDNGLMLYDTDLNTIYIWDGAKWNTTSQVSGGPKLQYPYRDSVTAALAQPMIYLQYNNPNATQMFYLERFDTTNVTNPFVVEHFGRGAVMAIYQHYKGTGISSLLDNAVNPNMAIRGTTVGTGAGIQGLNNGTGNGFAGLFSIGQPTNTYPAIQANSKGSGSSFRAFQNPTDGTGNGFDAYMFNPASTGSGIFVTHQGLGRAGQFIISNASSTAPALDVETNGTGVAGNFVNTGTNFAIYAQAKGNADAIYARKQAGDGTGSAGNFTNEEPNNPASTLFAMTNAPSGFGLGSMNTAGGNAFAIFQGGMKVSTATLSAGTTITTRAIAYQITGGGPYTFSLTPALSDGEMFYVFNSSGGSVTVSGTAIPSNSGIVFIVLGGVARAF